MKRFLSVLLFGATVAVASTTGGQTTTTQTTTGGGQAIVTPQPAAGAAIVTPQPAAAPVNPHLEGLRKCDADFDDHFSVTQCMRYTDIGFKCQKDAAGDLACEDKIGINIVVPLTDLKEELTLKQRRDVLYSKSRLVEAFGRHHKQEKASNAANALISGMVTTATGTGGAVPAVPATTGTGGTVPAAPTPTQVNTASKGVGQALGDAGKNIVSNTGNALNSVLQEAFKR